MSTAPIGQPSREEMAHLLEQLDTGIDLAPIALALDELILTRLPTSDNLRERIRAHESAYMTVRGIVLHRLLTDFIKRSPGLSGMTAVRNFQSAIEAGLRGDDA